MEDLKRSLGTTEKPDITHVRKPIMVAIARACEYGSAKYERSNFLRSQDDAKGDFLRFRSYLRACLSHVVETLDSMEQHQANDPSLLDVEGMDRAAYAADTDPDTTGKIGPSGLPHVYGAAASLMMAISQATQGGLLPDDAGQPWAKTVDVPAWFGDPIDAIAMATMPLARLRALRSEHPHKTPCECVGCRRLNAAGVAISFDHTGAKSDVVDPPDPKPKRVFLGYSSIGVYCQRCPHEKRYHNGDNLECPT